MIVIVMMGHLELQDQLIVNRSTVVVVTAAALTSKDLMGPIVGIWDRQMLHVAMMILIALQVGNAMEHRPMVVQLVEFTLAQVKVSHVQEV